MKPKLPLITLVCATLGSLSLSTATVSASRRLDGIHTDRPDLLAQALAA